MIFQPLRTTPIMIENLTNQDLRCDVRLQGGALVVSIKRHNDLAIEVAHETLIAIPEVTKWPN